MFDDILKEKKIVIYGLSTETERVINEWGDSASIVGLLDSFQTEGMQFGYPILNIEDVVLRDDIVIIVVARPGSCKAIAKRIGKLCKENNVELYDIRGNDLLAETKTVYDFATVTGYTKKDFDDAASKAEALSFDFFDTLVVRNVPDIETLFRLVEARQREKEIFIPDFANKRVKIEKRLSSECAPTLSQIYDEIVKDVPRIEKTSQELADLEFSIECEILEPRVEVVQLLKKYQAQGKKIYITSDSYYSRAQFDNLMKIVGVSSVDGILISCEHRTGKTGELFSELIRTAETQEILHIGDDVVADIEASSRYGIKSFFIYSSSELLEKVGGLNLFDKVISLSDQIRIGLFSARLFNSPFQFEKKSMKIHSDSSADIGYLFCAPMIIDFVSWFEDETEKLAARNIWLGSRDGFLLKKAYQILFPGKDTVYFYTSRIAAVRAGVETLADIEYVDSMKYSGAIEENLKTRFGLSIEEMSIEDIDADADGLKKYAKGIIDSSKTKKKNYLKYIDNINLEAGDISFFDFVAKGTCQMYLQKLVNNHIRGLYFLQLEPEFMKERGLDITPFYTENEREDSAIFDHYYILETLLTAPEPSIDEFDENGCPVFAEETRKKADIECFMRAQEGILDYIERYSHICPKKEIKINKKLDEELLALISHIEIRDVDFVNLSIEDPFFNRMTDMTDVL